MTQFDKFKERINALLQTWEALSLAIQNDSDGIEQGLSKRQSLCDEVVNYFTEYGDNIDEDDMVQFYEQFFVDVYEIGVEDGSLEIFSHDTCKLFAELDYSNSPVWNRIQEKVRTAVSIRKDLHSHPAVHEENSPDIILHDAIEMSNENDNTVNKIQSNKPVIDEDGWQTVTRKSRKRN